MVVASPGNGVMAPDTATANAAMLDVRKQQVNTMQRSVSPVSARGTEYREERVTPRSPAGSVYSAQRAMSPGRTRFECDYDSNPTELYLAIQRKDWRGAEAVLDTEPHDASTWAPLPTIKALLDVHPEAAACKDDQGMLAIHLAFRNGASEQVVQLLLQTFPQSVNVEDRKGRTPMVLAKQSSHPNKDAYIAILQGGPAFYALSRANRGDSSVATTTVGGGRVAELEAELAKTQETSEVLVDHVNSLEAQLASRSDTERFLATKIATLMLSLRLSPLNLKRPVFPLPPKTLNSKRIMPLLRNATKIEKVKEYKVTNKDRFEFEEKIEKAEKDAASAQANVTALEATLQKKIESEKSLASQVSMLASQLASSANSTTEATSHYQVKCEELEGQNSKLRSQIAVLNGKLTTVASALDAMSAEQERIIEAAVKHEQTMATAIEAHKLIVATTAKQESLMEEAAKEREEIVAILMRQAEDSEKTVEDREKVLDMVKELEPMAEAATTERDAVVASVQKQREYMDFMMNGELQFLKKTVSEEENADVIEEKTQEMESKKEEFLTEETPVEESSPEEHIGDVEEAAAE
ncbi:hypothetical protein QTG54_011853 [Skeletonema marinoi]|uniref:Uncharacterized protein n=1 Tax=Skeletonema marinoi TaxID=267567 RepID=A0AAD8Y1A0_9STRA|nr:hypothetical protein QTG54_011853 [Skeletonema marinoi]